MAADTPPPGNLVPNSSFETADPNVNWMPFRSSIVQADLTGDPTAPEGTKGVTVTAGPLADALEGYSMDDKRPSGGANVPAGTQFVASVWMRAAAPSSVGRPGKIWIRERGKDGSLIQRVKTEVPLTAEFQKIVSPVYTTTTEGSAVDVYVAQNPAAPGDAFTADLVTLTRNLPPSGTIGVSPANPKEGDTVTFTSASVADPDGGTVATRAWDTSGSGAFADGTAVTTTRKFTTAGVHTIRLRAADQAGATAILTRTITVTGSGTGAGSGGSGSSAGPGGGAAPVSSVARKKKPKITRISVNRRAGVALLRFNVSQSVRLVWKLDAKRVDAPGYAKLSAKTIRRVASGRVVIPLGTLAAGKYRITLTARNTAGKGAKAIKVFVLA